MKTPKIIHCFLAIKIKTLIAALFSTCLLYSAMGQGALTPPGAPAAMMKSLDQIEPRTPVNTNTAPGNSYAEFVISQPGSYYLTGNIMGVSGQNGIEIATNNVTLDLEGFSVLVGSAANYNGIIITNNCNNITVRNGIISGGWGTAVGPNGNSSGDIFEHLTVSGTTFGMGCGGNSIIKDCLVVSNAWYGITIGGNGGSLVIDNEIAGNDTANQTGVGALYANCSNNRIEGNHVTGSSGHGLWIPFGANNIVIRNSVIGFGANNYVITSGNDVGPIGVASTSASPWANFSH